MKTITIYGREMKTKTGKKWVKYTYVSPKGKWYQVKVSQKSSLQLNNALGYIKITFGNSEFFVKEGEVKNGFKENDTIWVLELEDFEEDIDAKMKAEERATQKAEELANDLFEA